MVPSSVGMFPPISVYKTAEFRNPRQLLIDENMDIAFLAGGEPAVRGSSEIEIGRWQCQGEDPGGFAELFAEYDEAGIGPLAGGVPPFAFEPVVVGKAAVILTDVALRGAFSLGVRVGWGGFRSWQPRRRDPRTTLVIAFRWPLAAIDSVEVGDGLVSVEAISPRAGLVFKSASLGRAKPGKWMPQLFVRDVLGDFHRAVATAAAAVQQHSDDIERRRVSAVVLTGEIGERVSFRTASASAQ